MDILKQIIDGNLSKEFDYHRLPAPWLQIAILKLLTKFGKDDKE